MKPILKLAAKALNFYRVSRAAATVRAALNDADGGEQGIRNALAVYDDALAARDGLPTLSARAARVRATAVAYEAAIDAYAVYVAAHKDARDAGCFKKML